MTFNQSLTDVTTSILEKLQAVLSDFDPAIALVHGDTTTTMSASLAGFYNRTPIAHVEAGLRTGDKYSPWPEEINRRITAQLADLHFAPTLTAKENLEREGIQSEKILITGNTVVDALSFAARKIEINLKLNKELASQFSYLDPQKRIIVVTGHRRENFGDGMEGICEALKTLARRDDLQIVYPAHLNPKVQEPVMRLLANAENIHVCPPLDYASFVYLLTRSWLILTDSGGIQEEAPSLKKPVLVMRDTTERPEAISAGTAKLVGTKPDVIVRSVMNLLEDSAEYASMALKSNPFGDGFASVRIEQALEKYFDLGEFK